MRYMSPRPGHVLPMSGDDKPALTKPVVHLHHIVRDLRQIAGITRMAFAEEIGMAATDYRRWEEGRWPPTQPWPMPHGLLRRLASKWLRARLMND